MKEDPLLNDIWKAPLTKAMNLDEEISETCDVSEYLCHLEQARRILRDEILLSQIPCTDSGSRTRIRSISVRIPA